jgi:hypothetical protein
MRKVARTLRVEPLHDTAEADRADAQASHPSSASIPSRSCAASTTAMAMIHRDWQEFLSALRSENTRFLLIGAHALAFHVEARFTEDLDIFVVSSCSGSSPGVSTF